MAYTFGSPVATLGSAITITTGEVYRWGEDGADPVLLQAVVTQEISATTANMLDPAYFTLLSGVIDPQVQSLNFYLRSGVADNNGLTTNLVAAPEYGFTAVAGTSYMYGDPASSDYGIVTAVQTHQSSAFYNSLFTDPAYFTVVRPYTGNLYVNQSVYELIDYTPPVVAVTLVDKTIAGFTKVAQLLGENRTHIKTAEAEIVNLQSRVSNVESAASGKASIDDAALASTTTVLSASKTMQEIADAEQRAKNAAVEAIMDGVTPAELDSLREIATDLTSKDTVIGNIVTGMAKKVSIESQTLTSNEKAQVHTNLGIKSAADTTTEITTAINDKVGDPSLININTMFSSVGAF